MRVVRAVQVLPPLRSSDRTRRLPGDSALDHDRKRRGGFRRYTSEPDLVSAPHGVATFVTQQIAQEWNPAPPADAESALSAYRRETARRRRDLLPKA